MITDKELVEMTDEQFEKIAQRRTELLKMKLLKSQLKMIKDTCEPNIWGLIESSFDGDFCVAQFGLCEHCKETGGEHECEDCTENALLDL